MSRADRAVLVRRLRALVGGPGPRTGEHAGAAAGDRPGARGPTGRIDEPPPPVPAEPGRKVPFAAEPAPVRDVPLPVEPVPAARVPVEPVPAARVPGPTVPGPHVSVPARGWVPGAVASAAATYADAYGGPPGRGGPVREDVDATDEPRRRSGRRWRWGVSWRLAVAAVVVVAVLGGVVAVRALALSPGPPVALPEASPVAAADGATAGAPSATAGTVTVHVVGAVAAPGVVALPTGSRVIDALDAAGGASADAVLAAINLARPLVDGEQVVVPRTGDLSGDGGSAATPEGTSTLDLNTADAAALDELPGIGPVLAGRIIERRTEHPFTSVDELDEVDGIGTALVERLRALVHV